MPKKRGNGQGWARRRGRTWTAVWTVGWEVIDGKRRQHCKTKGGFKTKTEALLYAANPLGEDTKKTPNLQHYWDSWSESSMTKMSKSKQTAYRIAKAKLGSIIFTPIDELSIAQLQDVIDTQAPTYYPARDIKTLLSHLYKRAIAEEYVHTNLADFIVLPTLEEKEILPFTEDELHKLWTAYGNGDTFVGYILLMIYTGMMPGELLKLKKDMIDWNANEIHGAGLKTKKRKETPIVYPEQIAPVLLDLCQSTKSKVGNVLGMNKDNFYVEYHAALKRAGTRDLAPYSCRHTTATALALGNIAPSIIQEVMRHTKFTTTQRYIHPDTQSAHDAVNSLSKGKEPT